ERPDKPLLLPGIKGSWDDLLTTNPSFVKTTKGEYWLYYKSLNAADYNSAQGGVRGNRQYGLAVSKNFEGPYIKYKGNPVVDFSSLGDNKQFEDAYVWFEDNKFKMIARDLGVYGMNYGLYLESKDGKSWSDP